MNSIKKHNQSVENLWNAFLKVNPNNPIKKIPLSFYFCDNKKDADTCANLVVTGKKQATATSLWWFETHNEPLPKAGDQFVITDWDENAKAPWLDKSIVSCSNEFSVQYDVAANLNDTDFHTNMILRKQPC